MIPLYVSSSTRNYIRVTQYTNHSSTIGKHVLTILCRVAETKDPDRPSLHFLLSFPNSQDGSSG